MVQKNVNHKKVLMVGPLPTAGNYVGGIGVISSQILEHWNLPYDIVTYNTNTILRDFGSANRLNFTNVCKFFRDGIQLVSIIRNERPDIVHFHTSRHRALLKDLLLVGLIRIFGHCRVVGHIHHASYSTLLVGDSEWGRLVQIKWLMAAFDRIVLMSEGIKQTLASRLSPASRARFDYKTKVLYNFTSLPGQTDHGPRAVPAKPTLFFIGNVGRFKGIFDLLNCADALKRAGVKFEVVLAGPFDSPHEGERIKKLIESLNLSDSVKLIGPVSSAAKGDLFAAADIFVLPSYGEGVPLSMLEAMSYGLPVVATAVGGIPEILNGEEAGFLVPPGDVDALKAAVQKLILSSDLRREMGKKGRERIEEFHRLETFLERLGSIYQELSAAAPGADAVEVNEKCRPSR